MKAVSAEASSLSRGLLRSPGAGLRRPLRQQLCASLVCATACLSAIGVLRAALGATGAKRQGVRPASLADAGIVNTRSLTVTREAYDSACASVGLDSAKADALWTQLAYGSSVRVATGATAPREDAPNVNQWHFSTVDVTQWAKDRLRELLSPIEPTDIPNKGWIKFHNITIEGDASITNRKGKKIVIFDHRVTADWKGQIDYTDVEGSLLLPEVSQDIADGDDFEAKVTAKDRFDPTHKRAVEHLNAQLPRVQKVLRTFSNEIFKNDPKDMMPKVA